MLVASDYYVVRTMRMTLEIMSSKIIKKYVFPPLKTLEQWNS